MAVSTLNSNIFFHSNENQLPNENTVTGSKRGLDERDEKDLIQIKSRKTFDVMPK